jgi:hypothetical protein
MHRVLQPNRTVPTATVTPLGRRYRPSCLPAQRCGRVAISTNLPGNSGNLPRYFGFSFAQSAQRLAWRPLGVANQ